MTGERGPTEVAYCWSQLRNTHSTAIKQLCLSVTRHDKFTSSAKLFILSI